MIFSVTNYSTEAFRDAIKRARARNFSRVDLWTKLMARAMERDFSWAMAAQSYEKVYAELVGASEEAAA